MKKRSKRTIRGFTLIEMLVTMGLFAVVSSVIVTVLFSAFRASKKAETIVAVKDKGDIALAQMTKSIKYARSLDNPAACTTSVTQSSVTITALDNGQTTYSCPNNISTFSISSNSAGLIDTTNVGVSACSFTCTQRNTNDPPTLMINFILTAKNGNTFGDNRSTIPFQTSVTLRNFTP